MKKHVSLVLLIISQMAAAEDIQPFKEQANNTRSEIIEGSYIVTMDPDKPEVAALFDTVKKRRTQMRHSAKVREDLAVNLNVDGEVKDIYPSIHAVHIKMNSFEAHLLRNDKRVLKIEPDMTLHIQGAQSNPGWALDRSDSPTPALDNAYHWNANGAGRTIYILDSGINTSLPEFGGRATTFWDVNDPDHVTSTWGQDCHGHGTAVADAAGGNRFGVAKGVSLISAKITNGCTDGANLSTSILAFDWLAANAPAGTIVNWSSALSSGNCVIPAISTALEDSMKAAHAHGVIIVVAAGNDGCNTANYSPTRIDEVFVVGATTNTLLSLGMDEKASFSRTGWQIDLFAPGQSVPLYRNNGLAYYMDGTSFSAPYVSGLFAIGCQLYPAECSQPQVAFNELKNVMTPNTVTGTNGLPLKDATPLMIKQSW